MKFIAGLDGNGILLVAMPHDLEWLMNGNTEPFKLLTEKPMQTSSIMHAASELLNGNSPSEIVYGDQLTKVFFEEKDKEIGNFVVNVDETFYSLRNKNEYSFHCQCETTDTRSIQNDYAIYKESEFLACLSVTFHCINPIASVEVFLSGFEVTISDFENKPIVSKKFVHEKSNFHNFTIPMLVSLVYENTRPDLRFLKELSEIGNLNKNQMLQAL